MKKIKLKKSQRIILGSLIILVGIMFLSYGKFMNLREEVYEEVKLSLIDNGEEEVVNNEVAETPIANNVQNASVNEKKRTYNYNYIGYLEVPRVGLKRGFLNKDDKYNNIQYNVMISPSSNMPDEERGNVILIAHSGDSYISYFAYLYKLKLGDKAYITYNGKRYAYSLVKIEEEPKTGTIAIHRPDYNTKSLTLITCTKDNDYTQTVYIFNIV